MAKRKSTSANPPSKVLAANLFTWSQLHGLEKDPYVEYLTSSLLKRRNFSLLAEMDPLVNLPLKPATLKPQASFLIQTLTVLRNTLVFAPVALTWSAVSHATSGFAAYIDKNPDSVANFLQFWQNGYGFLASEWKIGTVANLDFLIIMAVIALTLYISLTNNKVITTRHREIAAFRDERMRLALQLKEFLDTKRRVTPTSVEKAVAKSVQSFENTSLALDQASELLHLRISALEKEML